MLCTFGPPLERKRMWLLKFEDPNKGDMFFTEPEEAIAMWLRAKDNWSCTLFVTAEL